MTKDIERRLSQTSAALALVEYWRNEAEHQRTRAEAAEQELRDYTAHVAQSKNEDRSKLAAIRAHLAGVDVAALSVLHKMADANPNAWLAFYMASAPVTPALLAAAREALEP